MEAILITMLTGLVVNLITYLSGKLGLSKTYVSVGLCILIGVILYVGQIIIQKYPLQWEQILQFVSGAYAMSQLCYNIAVKLGIIKKEESTKMKK